MGDTFRLATFCAYLVGDYGTIQPAQDFWHANKFINALKRDEVRGWAEIPICLQEARKTLRETNKQDAFGWFGEIVAAQLNLLEATRLVPVPSSSAMSEKDVISGSTYELAKEIAARQKVTTVEALLWFATPMVSAHGKKGTRDAKTLYDALVLKKKPAEKPSCVLVDDVATSLGHLQACEAKLREAGIVVRGALCAGRTVYDESRPAFGMVEELVAKYVP